MFGQKADEMNRPDRIKCATASLEWAIAIFAKTSLLLFGSNGKVIIPALNAGRFSSSDSQLAKNNVIRSLSTDISKIGTKIWRLLSLFTDFLHARVHGGSQEAIFAISWANRWQALRNTLAAGQV